ncbi:MAG: glycosyltransferase family 8 protein [Boseongicola sp. SB0662_bin_57]|nr:glycosyltransferase family 8 protein [Boseongicola sp. SB0662_bin_57]
MQVVYGVNSSYLFPALVSAYSIWKNASHPVDITIFGDKFGHRDHDFIRQVGTRCGHAISVRNFDSSRFDEFSRTSQARFPAISLLPLVLPRLIEGRCLFLDADTLVLGDVWELLSSDLGGMPIGACIDAGQVRLSGKYLRTRKTHLMHTAKARNKRAAEIRRISSLGFIPGEQYFNSGVMVMDCDAIRESMDPDELSSQDGLRPFLNHWPDQDRLNEVFAGRWHQFPLKWNASTSIRKGRILLTRNHWSGALREQMHEAANYPQIRHFMGSKKKPWTRSWRSFIGRKAYRDYAGVLREFEAKVGLNS